MTTTPESLVDEFQITVRKFLHAVSEEIKMLHEDNREITLIVRDLSKQLGEARAEIEHLKQAIKAR